MSDDSLLTARFSHEFSLADLENPVWKQTEPAAIQHLWSGEIAPESRHAEARIIWSNESLTVRFRCNQSEPLIVNSHPDLTKKKIGLWESDVCELFVAPGPATPARYLEFEVAPTGEWIDLAIDFTSGERETDWEFHSGMKAAAKVLDDEVLMAMQIPWSASLPRPKMNDVWRINLFRCVGNGNQRYLAWQPTGTPEPLFHVPEAFGRLKFV